MAKPVKDKWFGARYSAGTLAPIHEYLKIAEMDGAELIRQAVVEYMANHPVKKPKAPINLKPGA